MRLITLLFVMFCTVESIAQIKNPNADHTEKSKVENFISKSGSLIKKQFLSVGKINKLEISALKITDVLGKQTINGVKFETSIVKSYGNSEASCFLDEDEVENFLNSGIYLLETAPLAQDEGYLEFQFTSRSGFQSGIYKDRKGSWSYFLKLDKYDGDSYVFLKKEEFDQVIDLVRSAKSKF